MNLKDLLFRTAAFIQYRLKAGNAHGLHSPFVYSLYTECISKKEAVPAELKSLRARLRKDQRILNVEDFGAGGYKGKYYKIPVSRIARRAAKPEHYSMLLAKICRYYKVKSFLELGTSLGLSTSSVAKLNPDCKLITVEGSKEIQGLAQENFASLGLKNIESHCGRFEIVLPSLLKNNAQFDLIFIDGNHRKEPTLRYFEMLLPHTHESSVIIFDDIHWSREMNEAWELIKSDPRVSLTVDLFAFGLVFFKSGRAEKQSFVLRS